jgi:hypothetical protein
MQPVASDATLHIISGVTALLTSVVLLTNIIKIRLCAQIIYRVKYRVYYEKPLVL